jgi:hypothetical protein
MAKQLQRQQQQIQPAADANNEPRYIKVSLPVTGMNISYLPLAHLYPEMVKKAAFFCTPASPCLNICPDIFQFLSHHKLPLFIFFHCCSHT